MDKSPVAMIQRFVQGYDFDEVAKQWIAEHIEWLLRDDVGLPEENTHWGQWLDDKRSELVQEFAKAMMEDDDEQELASAETLKGKWEKWINDQMFFLVEEWREDYNWWIK